MFSFVRNRQTIFQRDYTILCSHQQRMRVHTLSISVVSVLDCDHSNGCVVGSHCYFHLYFPNDICGASFHLLICHLYIFSGEVSVQIFCPFLMGLFDVLSSCFKSSLWFFWIQVLYQICVLQIFPPRLWLFFILLRVCLLFAFSSPCMWSSHSSWIYLPFIPATADAK